MRYNLTWGNQLFFCELNSGKVPRFKSQSLEMQFRSLLMRQSFGNPSSHHHLSLFSHRICLALFSLLAWIKLSRSFPGRRLNPTFAAVWVRLSGPHRPGCKHDVTLQSASKLFSAEQLHTSSRGWHHKWTVGPVDGGEGVLFMCLIKRTELDRVMYANPVLAWIMFPLMKRVAKARGILTYYSVGLHSLRRATQHWGWYL